MSMDIRRFIIIFIPIFLFSLVSSLSFQLESPDKVNQGESFEVTISMENPQAIYDVKIYINDDSKEFSEIYSQNSWKSPFYYLKSVFPDQTAFQIKAHFTGETQICAKLRNSEKNSETKQVCNPIIVSPSENSEEIPEQTPKQSTKPRQDIKTESIQEKSTASQPIAKEEKIILTSPVSSKVSNGNIFYSSKEKTMLFITFFFLFICLLIILLFSFRRI